MCVCGWTQTRNERQTEKAGGQDSFSQQARQDREEAGLCEKRRPADQRTGWREAFSLLLLSAASLSPRFLRLRWRGPSVYQLNSLDDVAPAPFPFRPACGWMQTKKTQKSRSSDRARGGDRGGGGGRRETGSGEWSDWGVVLFSFLCLVSLSAGVCSVCNFAYVVDKHRPVVLRGSFVAGWSASCYTGTTHSSRLFDLHPCVERLGTSVVSVRAISIGSSTASLQPFWARKKPHESHGAHAEVAIPPHFICAHQRINNPHM